MPQKDLILPLAFWLMCCFGGSVAIAQTNRTWVGSVSSDWFNATNWSPVGVPASNDTVNVTNGSVNLSAPVICNGQFNWSGGTLSGDTLTIATNGVMTMSGSDTLFLETGLLNAGTVAMTNSGSLDVRNDTLFGYSGLIENMPGALWDIQNNQSVFNDYTGPAYFHNAGTFLKSGLAGTTIIYIPYDNSGLLTALQGALSFNGGGTLAGTFAASNAASILFSAGDFTNSEPATVGGSGAIELDGGSLTLLSDTISNLDLAYGNLVLGPDFQGGSITNLTLSGATLVSSNTVTGVFNWTAGALAAPLTIATNGLLTMSGSATLYLENALTNEGTVDMTNSGSLVVSYASGVGYFGLIENLPGAMWDIQNDQIIAPNYTGPAYFHNAGTLLKSGLAGTTTIYIPYDNSGLVTASQGTLSFNGGGTLAGTFDAGNATSILFSAGNFTNSEAATLGGSGAIELDGGSLMLLSDTISNLALSYGNLILGPDFQGGAITNLTLSGATLVSSNTVTGVFNWNGGTLAGPLTVATNGLLTMSGSATLYLENALTNAGTVDMTNSGSLVVSYSSGVGYFGLIENLPGAIWDIQNDQIITPNYTGPAYFHNAGTLLKSGLAGTTTIYIPYDNSGTTMVLRATMALNADFNAAGGTLLFGMSSPTDYGKMSIAGNATLAGVAGVLWLNGFVPAYGNSFTLLTYGSYSGAFSAINLPSAAQWQTTYGPTSFTVAVAGINQLAFSTEPSGGEVPNQTLAPAVVQVEDEGGNPLATNDVAVTLSLYSGGGTLNGTLTQLTGPSGQATFGDLSISLVGTKTLIASSPGLTPAVSGPFAIVPLFAAQPTNDGVWLQLNGTNSLGPTTIYASTNLVSWLPIYTNPAASGPIYYLDAAATNFPLRFYRYVEQ
jgi:fibronectin-binding autotransporter adhesin